MPSAFFMSSTAFYKDRKATGKRMERKRFREVFKIRETLVRKNAMRGKREGRQ